MPFYPSRQRKFFVSALVLVAGVGFYNGSKYKRIRARHSDQHQVYATTFKRRIVVGEDCNSLESKCYYFRPTQFVAEWEKTHKRTRRWTKARSAPLHRCYKNMIHIYALECNADNIVNGRCVAPQKGPKQPGKNETGQNNATVLNLPTKFAYKKLYKTGGTAVDFILRGTVSSKKNMQMKVFRPLKAHQNSTGAHNFMGKVAYNQNVLGIDHPVVAVVRDPLERFVSAANQLLGMKNRLTKCKIPSGTNEKTSSRGMMRCAVEALIKGHRDPHFESLVADMHCSAGNGKHDVQYSLYSMSDVSELFFALGYKNSTEKINSSEEKSITLSIADLDEKSIQKVCRWYAADVEMMKSIGFHVEHC